MTPEQRIAAVLKSRGREVTPKRITAWLSKMRDRYSTKHAIRADMPTWSRALADAIEDGNKTWTMCLHIEFGDEL